MVQAAAAVALVAGIAAPAAAQSAPAPRQIAVYKFDVPEGARYAPAKLSVVDSAGTLVARLWLASDVTARRMSVDVAGRDLVLRAITPRGTAQFVLYGQSEGIERPFRGRWQLGTQQGQLIGKSAAD